MECVKNNFVAGGDQANVGGREEQEGRAVADQPRQETTSVVFRQFLVRSGKFFLFLKTISRGLKC